MTRFARAKGSKASNEKLPNEATPWYVMKQQLEGNKYEAPLDKKISAKELLKDEKGIHDSNLNENNDWAELDDNRSNFSNNISTETQKHKHKNSILNKIHKNPEKNSQNDNTDCIISKNKKTKKLEKTKDTEIKTTKNKKNKSSNKKKQNINLPCNKEKESNTSQQDNLNSTILSKRQKRNLVMRKRKLEMVNNDIKRFKTNTSSQNAKSKTREEGIKEKGEYKRRKPDSGIIKMIINGVEIKIVKYDGFPIKKEDADRLKELKQKMVMKGISDNEINTAMKLERRKAEKALARVKKLVCFHCRKSGHNLSDCPELDNKEIPTGICFKCGSTEHTHFECKVNKDTTYRYATCFICREQGHIAAQCPDNPRGVYPNGGCCKICKAVTHLKKDCPDLTETKEDNAITVEKIDNIAIESLHEDKKKKVENSVVPKKIIKF